MLNALADLFRSEQLRVVDFGGGFHVYMQAKGVEHEIAVMELSNPIEDSKYSVLQISEMLAHCTDETLMKNLASSLLIRNTNTPVGYHAVLPTGIGQYTFTYNHDLLVTELDRNQILSAIALVVREGNGLRRQLQELDLGSRIQIP